MPHRIPVLAALLTSLAAGLAVRGEEPAMGRGRPLAFIENRGQWPPEARFQAALGGVLARVEEGGISLLLRGPPDGRGRGASCAGWASLRFAFEGACKPAVEGQDELRTTYNFFVGERSRWRPRVPAYRRIVLGELYAGVDLVLREGAAGGLPALEYDLVLEPGARLDEVAVRCEGALGLALDADGSLLIATELGLLRQPPPPSWEELPGGRRAPVYCRYRLIDGERFGFEALGRDDGLLLVIDPVFEWAYFLGGAAHDWFNDLALSPDGVLVALGETASLEFPEVTGEFVSEPHGGPDVLLARIDPESGAVLSMTFLGGGWADGGVALAFDAGGNIVLGGYTSSEDFPVTDDSTYHGFSGNLQTIDAFVARLSRDGHELQLSTLIGGAGEEAVTGVAVESSGDIVASGYTSSTDLAATPGAFQERHRGGLYDAFVARLASSSANAAPRGRLLYLTYLGGSGDENWPDVPGRDFFPSRLFSGAIAVEAEGEVIVVGHTRSANFPVTPGAFDTIFAPASDVYLSRMRLDPGLPPEAQLRYSTFLGGHGRGAGAEGEAPARLVKAPAEGYWIGGWTDAPDFPTTPGAFARSASVANDGFLALLVPDAALPPADQLVYSTYLRGSGGDLILGLQVGASGVVTAGGLTNSPDFPRTPGAFPLDSNRSQADAFLLQLRPDPALPPAEQLLYSNLFGGSGWDQVDQIVLLPSGKVAVSISTPSLQLPAALPGVYGHGGVDAFLALLPLPCHDCPPEEEPAGFLRGDANGDLVLDISDAIAALLFLFAGGSGISCPDALDGNDDGQVDISDPIYALAFLFLGGPPPPPPFPACGPDPTEDNVGCENPPCR
jgi:hypothetical protein